MSEWKPIDTAPEDRAVLVADAGHVEVAYMDEGTWRLSDMAAITFEPTHWRPLPEFPGTKGQQE